MTITRRSTPPATGLDKLAREDGLTPLAAFESYSPDELEEFEDEPPGGDSPAEWFSPAAGRAAVEALRAYLVDRPDAVVEQGDVLEELAMIASELRAAERAEVRFRFAVMM